MSLEALRIIDEEFQKELDGLTARLVVAADAGTLLRRLQTALRSRVMEEAVELPEVPAPLASALVLFAHDAVEHAIEQSQAGNLSTLDPDPADQEFGDPNRTMPRGEALGAMRDEDYTAPVEAFALAHLCPVPRE